MVCGNDESPFLQAGAGSTAETIATVEHLQDLQRQYRERFQTARRSALMLRIIDLMFERPVRSITDFVEPLGGDLSGRGEIPTARFGAHCSAPPPRLGRHRIGHQWAKQNSAV